MPRYRSKKYGHIYERCDNCGRYSCFSDGNGYYCGICYEAVVNKKGITFIRRFNAKENNTTKTS